jgi:hypothetical protein
VKLGKFAGFSERARRRKGEPSAKLQGDLGRGSGKLAGGEALSVNESFCKFAE